MTSILTNIAAMSALQTLRSIGSSMEETQARVSSGLRVGQASDNAAYWSIATTMRSDNLALDAVQDALGLGAAKVDTAYAGMNAAIDVVKEIKAKVVAATEQGVDKNKVQEEITQLQGQLRSIAEGASFSGENWLVFDSTAAGAVATKTVVSGFVRTDDTVKVTTTDRALVETDADLKNNNVLFGSISAAGVGAGGILGTAGDNSATGGLNQTVDALNISTLSDADLALSLTLVENALQTMTSVGADLGSISMRIGLQEDFVNALSDSIESGIGRLVDADMNEESTRLKALQTQQQLGIQSLSIANSSSENILSLFR
jgi:flagellin